MANRFQLLHGDCVEVLKALADNSIDSVVTDPPYGLEFMGKGWDAPWRENGLEAPNGFQIWATQWCKELYRVLKPGGHILAFGGTRMYHRLACAVEDAGFEIRDSIHWVYGSGFPKSLDVSWHLDKTSGNLRADRVVAEPGGNAVFQPTIGVVNKGNPITDEAKRWNGWGTALKPSHEPIVVARKPFPGTVCGNLVENGVGAMNIDACRVKSDDVIVLPTHPSCFLGGTSDGWNSKWKSDPVKVAARKERAAVAIDKANELGRWPPNFLLNHLPECTEVCAKGCPVDEMNAQDEVGPARFFPSFRYQAKPSLREKNTGLDEHDKHESGVGALRDHGRGKKAANIHPTVKPVQLMRWLVRLVTPKNGVVIDPFMGSGTTGVAAVAEGIRFIGIEREQAYIEICRSRISHAANANPEDFEQLSLFDYGG